MINFLTDKYFEGDGSFEFNKLFYLSSLDVDTNLTSVQSLQILHRLQELGSINDDIIEDLVFSYRFLNAGGDENTPTSEVVSFCYLMFTKDIFDFKDDVHRIAISAGFSGAIDFCVKNDIKLPSPFAIYTKKYIGDFIYDSIVKDTDLKISEDSSAEAVIKFIVDLKNKHSEDSALYSFLAGMGISTSDEIKN